MIKQYLMATSFTRGNTPLEYEYTVEKCDMRKTHSKNRNKYEWFESLEKLFKIVEMNGVKVKVGRGGELRLIMLNGSMAYLFLKAVQEIGWKGVD